MSRAFDLLSYLISEVVNWNVWSLGIWIVLWPYIDLIMKR